MQVDLSRSRCFLNLRSFLRETVDCGHYWLFHLGLSKSLAAIIYHDMLMLRTHPAEILECSLEATLLHQAAQHLRRDRNLVNEAITQ